MVERFEFTCPDCDPDIHNVNLGRYVRHSDYAALEAQLAERVKVRPLDELFDEMHRRMDQPRYIEECPNNDWLPIDDTQIGVEFAHSFLSALEATPPAPKVTDDWLRDTAMDVMLATEVGEAMRILRAALTAAQEAGNP